MVRRVFARVAGVCGLLAFVTSTVGWVAGGLAQPASYSSARDDISDLGAVTASSPWLYNHLGANLTGLLVVALAIGLWQALSPDLLGRLGAAALLVAGAGSFLDGLFRLDCRGIDAACTNDSWHAHAHKVESGITAAAILLAPLIYAFAFRRIPPWRGAWLPTLAAIPAILLANGAFSAIGDGAATRAGTVVFFAWVAFVGAWLLWESSRPARPSRARRARPSPRASAPS
jgi:Protein of unknown function (DUF998)